MMHEVFRTSNIAIITDCCSCFGFQLPSELLINFL